MPPPFLTPFYEKDGKGGQSMSVAWVQYFTNLSALAAAKGSGGGTGATGPAGPPGAMGIQGAVGPPGPGSSGQYVPIVPGGGATATPDLSNGSGSVFDILLNAAVIAIQNPINTATLDFFWITLHQDSTGGRDITWGSNYVGVAHQLWADQAGFYISYLFVVRPDGKAQLLTLYAGGPYTGGPY